MKPLPRRRSRDFRDGFRVGQRLAHAWFRNELVAVRREVESKLAEMRAELDALRDERERTPPLKMVT
jgi:hypothetical protein